MRNDVTNVYALRPAALVPDRLAPSLSSVHRLRHCLRHYLRHDSAYPALRGQTFVHRPLSVCSDHVVRAMLSLDRVAFVRLLVHGLVCWTRGRRLASPDRVHGQILALLPAHDLDAQQAHYDCCALPGVVRPDLLNVHAQVVRCDDYLGDRDNLIVLLLASYLPLEQYWVQFYCSSTIDLRCVNLGWKNAMAAAWD